MDMTKDKQKIQATILRYKEVDRERTILDKHIRDWYEPQLQRAGEADDKVEF